MFRAAVSFILRSFFVLDIPNETKSDSCESKEQKPEMPSHSHGISEKATDKLEQTESTRPTDARSATDSKVSAPKSRSKTGRKLGAKK